MSPAPATAGVNATVRPRPLLELFPVSALDQPTAAPRSGGRLLQRPFAPTSNPHFLFRSRSHERAMAALSTVIDSWSGTVLLVGEAGAGRTMTCRALVGGLDRRLVSSLVFDPLGDPDGLLRRLLVDFGVASDAGLARTPSTTRADLERALIAFLDSLAALQARAVVVVDDADRQPAGVLERLSALVAHVRGARVLEVVLAGGPSLVDALKAPALDALAAGAVRIDLGGLDADEIDAYIAHRLRVSGSGAHVAFDQAALHRIFELSRGVPGIVSVLCDRVLGGTPSRRPRIIEVEAIDEAARDIGVDSAPRGGNGIARTVAVVLALAMLMLAGAAAAAWTFQQPLTALIDRWRGAPAAPLAPASPRPDPTIR